MALTKVAGDILDPGISIAGIVTATAFDGPFRGGSGKDINAGIGTFTQLDVNGPGDFSGIVTFSHTQDSTSASTGTIQVAGGIGIAKSVYIGGDLVVEGTTTTIDTTLKAVDRIEVADNSANVAVAITQTGAGDILNLFDGTTEVLTVLDTGEVGIGTVNPTAPLQINHGSPKILLEDNDNGADISILNVGGAAVLSAGSDITFQTSDTSEKVRIASTGKVGIGSYSPDAWLHIQTTSTTGDEDLIKFSRNQYEVGKIRRSAGTMRVSGDGNLFLEADYNADHGATDSNIIFNIDDDEKVRITKDGQVGINTTVSGGEGLGIMVDSSNTNPVATGAIALNLKNKNATDNTWVAMDFNNSAGGIVGRFGAQFIDTDDKSTDLYFATRQDGGDLTEAMRIYHENTGSTGMVKITAPNTGDMLNLQNSTGSGQGLIFGVNTTNHTTYWKNNTSSFYDATFILGGSERLRFTGEGKAGIGTTNPQHSLDVVGNIRSHTATPALYLQTTSDTASSAVIRFGDSGSFQRGSIQYDYSGNSHLRFKMGGAGNNVERLVLEGSTGHLTPGAAGTQNLGSTSKEWGDVFIADSKNIQFGNGQDLKIGFDGSNALIDLQTGSLSIIAYDNNEDVVIKSDNSSGGVTQYFRADGSTGEALLYHYGSQKFATSTTGITVTGEVAATQDYPDFRPVIDWNFAAVKKLDPRIRFFRSGVTATYVDKKGLIRYAGANQPRFDHHPTTGESLGLLLEPERHNKQEYSEDMTEADNQNNITITTNNTTSPDGTQNADKIVGSGSDSNTSIGWSGDTVPSGQYGSWSIFVKSDETSCILQFYSNTYIGGAARMNLELADGTTGGDANSSTWRWRVDKYPNKWWRVTWGGNGAGAAGGMYVGVVPSLTSARGATSGSATSKTFYAWGVQEEFNSMSKTSSSYIPTFGGSATRGSDGGTIDGKDFDDFFDRYQGTIIHEFNNELQDAGMGGGSGWELNNSDYQKNVITQISSGYAHNSYPGAYAVAYGESNDSGDNNISLFGSGSAPDNGAQERHGTGDGSRYYKYYRDAMSWDVTAATNILRVGSGGVANQQTNTSNISYRNISAFEFQPYAGHDMDGSYQRFAGRIKRWMYYDKVMTQNQLATMTDGRN